MKNGPTTGTGGSGSWIALAALAATLAGCAGQGRVVNVPVPVACIRAEQIPPQVAPTGPLPSDARNAADILGSKVLELRGTDRILRGLISACIATN